MELINCARVKSPTCVQISLGHTTAWLGKEREKPLEHRAGDTDPQCCPSSVQHRLEQGEWLSQFSRGLNQRQQGMSPSGDGIQPAPADGAVPLCSVPDFSSSTPFGREKLGLGVLLVPPRALSGDFSDTEEETILVCRVPALGKEGKREKYR